MTSSQTPCNFIKIAFDEFLVYRRPQKRIATRIGRSVEVETNRASRVCERVRSLASRREANEPRFNRQSSVSSRKIATAGDFIDAEAGTETEAKKRTKTANWKRARERDGEKGRLDRETGLAGYESQTSNIEMSYCSRSTIRSNMERSREIDRKNPYGSTKGFINSCQRLCKYVAK